MVGFTHVATLVDGPLNYVTGLSDLDICPVGGALVLYAATRSEGGMTAYALSEGRAAEIIDQEAYRSAVSRPAATRLEMVDTGEALLAILVGGNSRALASYTVAPDGSYWPERAFAGTDARQGDVVAASSATIGGRDYLYYSEWGQAGIVTHEIIDTRTLAYRGDTDTAAGPQGADLVALTTVQRGAEAYLLAASAFDNLVTSYRIGSDGRPEEVDSLGAVTGLGISAPTALETAEVDAASYVVLAAAGTSSLSVLRVENNGTLSVTDHVIDSLKTRFADVAALEVVTVGDRVFVLAGGGDDGISLFTLLPGGRLVHLSSTADTMTTALANVTALAATPIGQELQVFASSESEIGLTQFRVDLGPIGVTRHGNSNANTLQGTAANDVLMGYGGDDILTAGGGDDILVDGAGRDQLRGGGGADIFFLSADGEVDWVLDFQPGVDRLDLSGFSMLYSFAQLDVTPTTRGVKLRYGAEVINIVTADRTPLQSADLANLDLIGLSRPPRGYVTENILVDGGAGDDRLAGAALDNILRGRAGADVLDGGDGQDRADYSTAPTGVTADLLRWDINTGDAAGDTYISIEDLQGSNWNDILGGDHNPNVLLGGAGNDVLNGRGGNDMLNAGLGHDLLMGADGNDLLMGRGGNDVLSGGAGDDILNGGDGRDRLVAGSGNNRLVGEEGNDVLIGGRGRNVLVGGNGDDTIYDGAGNSVLYGGADNDRLIGGNGADRVYGAAGNDRLSGGNGADRIAGDEGNDYMVGGGGADIFILRPNSGADVIGDFENDLDRLFIESRVTGGDTNANRVLRDFAQLVDDDLFFDFGDGNTLRLVGVGTRIDLADDMVFV